MNATTLGFKHAEAFAHMEYYGNNKTGVITLRIWNSRDGVTPFMTYSKEYGIQLQHVNWQKDVFDPHYKPKKGDLIWASHNEKTATKAAEKSFDFHYAHLLELRSMTSEERSAKLQYDTTDILEKMLADKDEYIRMTIHELTVANGEPQPRLVLVDEDWK